MIDLSQDQWATQLVSNSNAVVIDVRAAEEVEEGIIPDALHLDIYKGQEFISALEKLDKSLSYFVYCRSGARSAQACSLMQQLGFTATFNLVGGFMEWNGPIQMP
jgi:rhodanese-related sulfurtransferase